MENNHTEETKQKLREIMKSEDFEYFKTDPRFRHYGKDNGMYGKNHTEESKERNRKKHLGKKVSD